MNPDAPPDTGPVLDILPVTGASISTIGDFLGTQTLTASDDRAARLDELQFDLGEGPCWDALATARPVLAPDLRHGEHPTWPALLDAIRDEGIGAVYAFPLLVGPLRIGAMDLYAAEPQRPGTVAADETQALAAIVSRHVLKRALRRAGQDVDEGGSTRFSRRAIHQATGFVIAQLGISAEDAHLLIQGQAFAEGRSMIEVAEDIVERRFSFTMSGSRIEDSR
jgi:hypothetical protein